MPRKQRVARRYHARTRLWICMARILIAAKPLFYHIAVHGLSLWISPRYQQLVHRLIHTVRTRFVGRLVARYLRTQPILYYAGRSKSRICQRCGRAFHFIHSANGGRGKNGHENSEPAGAERHRLGDRMRNGHVKRLAATVTTASGQRLELSAKSVQAGYPGHWGIWFAAGLDRLAEADMLTALDFRLLCRVAYRLSGVSYLPLAQDALAAEMRVNQAQVSRSLRRLCEVGVLERKSRGGRGGAAAYRVSPQFVHRGGVIAYQIAMRERLKDASDRPAGMRQKRRADLGGDLGGD